MSEYISREAAKEAIVKAISKGHSPFNAIVMLPAADVREVKHGKWIDDKVSFYLGCSECGCFLEYAVDTFLDNGDHYNFCPNCGADMMGKS